MNDVINTLLEQRTTRRTNFSSKTVSKELINIIKDSILKTPNASNRQSYSIIELDRGNANILGFPGDHVFLFCIDFYRLNLLAKKLDKEIDTNYLIQFSTALIDISMLTQSSVLAAQSLGVDTLVTNEVFHNKTEELCTHLGIPENHVFPMLALCLGYSTENETDHHGRLSPGIIFHQNKYEYLTSYDLEEIIYEYDDEYNKLGLLDNWRDLGFKHYLEWFFDKWFPVIGSRKQNEVFIEKLKKSMLL